jgi:hypothetical protein
MDLRGTCPFCGFTGKLTREDAFPTWVMKLIFPAGNRAWKGWGLGRASLGHGSQAQPSKGPILGYQWRSVTEPRLKTPICDNCNGKWLSPVEKQAKPKLKPWIRGLAVGSLTPSDRRLLGFWCSKTALMVDLARRQHIVPKEDYRELRLNDDHPPGGAHVWIAQRAVRYPGLAYVGGPLAFDYYGKDRLTPEARNGYLIVFGIHWFEVHLLAFGSDGGKPIEIADTTCASFRSTLDDPDGPFLRLWPEPGPYPLVLSEAPGSPPRPRARTPGWPGGWW